MLTCCSGSPLHDAYATPCIVPNKAANRARGWPWVHTLRVVKFACDCWHCDFSRSLFRNIVTLRQRPLMYSAGHPKWCWRVQPKVHLYLPVYLHLCMCMVESLLPRTVAYRGSLFTRFAAQLHAPHVKAEFFAWRVIVCEAGKRRLYETFYPHVHADLVLSLGL